MDKKSQFLYQFREFFVNSNSIPIPFFSIPIPSPIPGIESGIELNSHSIPELTPTLLLACLTLRQLTCLRLPAHLTLRLLHGLSLTQATAGPFHTQATAGPSDFHLNLSFYWICFNHTDNMVNYKVMDSVLLC